MYSQINQFSETVVGSIPHTHIADYEWLLQNTAQASSPDYQKRCRFYWAMNVAQMSPPFYTAYFGALDAAMKELMTLGEVTHILYDASARRDGRQSLQFSFATKLLHMTNPVLPIFDSQIAGFYFFSRGWDWAESTTENRRIRGVPRLPRSGICASTQVWTIGEGD